MGKNTQNLDKATIAQHLFENSFGQIKSCTTCCRKFGLFLRESKCYKCHRSTCNDCLLEKQKIVYVKSKKIFENDRKKICQVCSQELKNYAENYKSKVVGFCQNSPVAIQWIKTLNLINQNENSTNPEEANTIESIEKKYQQVYEKQLVKQTDVNYKGFMLSKVNYSFLTHLYYSTKGISFEEIQITLCRIINKLAFHYKWEKTPIKIDVFIMYLLCFSSEAVAYAIFTHLYENVLPKYIVEFMNFKSQQDQKEQVAQIAFFQSVIKANHELNDQQIQHVTNFLKKFSIDMLSSFFINVLSFEFSFEALDLMIKTQNFKKVENLLIVMILDNIQHIKEISSANYDTVYNYFCRIIEFKNISERVINYPTQEGSNMSKSTSHHKEEVNTNNKQNLQEHKLHTAQFQQNYEELMMSPNFNLLIGNSNFQNESTIGFHAENDDDEDTSPQSNRHQDNYQKDNENHQQQQKYTQGVKLPTLQNFDNVESSNRLSNQEHNQEVIQNYQDEPEEAVKRSRQSAQGQTELLIKDLQIERQTLTSENEKLKKEIEQKNQLMEQQKAFHEQEVQSLQNEINLLTQNTSSNPYKKLVEEYKALLNEAKQAYEELYQEKQEVELQLVSEKEEILVQSVRDKAMLMNEIQEIEAKNCSLLEQEQNADNAQKVEIKELKATIEQMTLEILTFKTEIQMLKEEQTINIEKLQKNQAILNEFSSQNKEKVEKEEDKLRSLQEIIDNLQRKLTQNNQEHKEEIQKIYERDNLVFDELRTQTKEYEQSITELTQQLEDANQKLILEKQLHETKILTLNQQQEVEKMQLKSDYEQQKSELIQQHNQTAQRLQKEIESLNQQMTQMAQELKQQHEQEKQVLIDQHNRAIQDKNQEIQVLEQRIQELLVQLEKQKAQLQMQFEEEKRILNQEMQQKIDELNQRLVQQNHENEQERQNLRNLFEQEKVQINQLHEQHIKEKQDEISQINIRIAKIMEDIESMKMAHQQELSVKQDEIESLKSQLEQKKTTIQSQQNEIEFLKSKQTDLEQKFIENNNIMSSLQITLLEKNDDLERLEKQINKKEQIITDLKQELEIYKNQASKYDEKLIQTMQEKIQNQEQEISKLKLIAQDHSNCEEIIKKLNEQLEKSKQKLKTKVQELMVFQNIFNTVKKTVSETKSSENHDDDDI
ncbi:hypothetical protein TTHERM_00019670 (macronuclear) [Tetrahymena thermophila SB210]|uniref:FYVE-type domain-containing protein n=1 Tax=Tetrahymena thermophila (strain SB210) TaxID=312017 RepID=Q22RB8_TETTS|nr:hypothetical protein TTHERM_00019670 [Tetrahymena thermophila SB210]EAR88204.2 hypothetical protein TTHERM_00019670 [Tetrahymena thermophila SB210]|eukprot:XP_001008449.2 hypothetical protein TTHERM_00019670 [Tetrahymena thermophila SB210]